MSTESLYLWMFGVMFVLPAGANNAGWEWDPGHPKFTAVKPRTVIANEVVRYFNQLPNPELWA